MEPDLDYPLPAPCDDDDPPLPTPCDLDDYPLPTPTEPSGAVYALPRPDGSLLLLNATAAAISVVPRGLSLAANQPIQAILTLPKQVSRGVSGLVSYGFNIHQSSWSLVGPLLAQMGCKALRINAGSQTLPVTDQAVAAGFTVYINLYGSQIAAAENIAAAIVKHGDRVILECGNEPNPLTANAAVIYYNGLAAFAAAVRKVNPTVRISAPAILASYSQPTKDFIYNWLRQPNAFDYFTDANFHPYYLTPEWSWQNDISQFVANVSGKAAKAGKSYEFVVGEVGWSNAIGALSDPSAENFGPPTGKTNIQPLEVATDYYSRYIPIARASARVRAVTFYQLLDETADPAMTNTEAHYGVFDYAATPKPAVAVCAELFAHCQSAGDAWMFTRGSDWFVKLALPSGFALIAWTTAGNHNANVLLLETAKWNVAGDVSKTEMAAGMATVPLGRRSIVITSPSDFPEFIT